MKRLDRFVFGLVGAILVAAHFFREVYPEVHRRTREKERERLLREMEEEA